MGHTKVPALNKDPEPNEISVEISEPDNFPENDEIPEPEGIPEPNEVPETYEVFVEVHEPRPNSIEVSELQVPEAAEVSEPCEVVPLLTQ